MPTEPSRISIDAVDWQAIFPFIRLFGSFRMAIRPGNLLLALMLTILVYFGGVGLDTVWGRKVYRQEVAAFHEAANTEQFRNWLAQRDERGHEPVYPIFESLLRAELDTFDQFIVSATQLDFGLKTFVMGERPSGVIGALRGMVITIPAWLWTTHPGFSVVYLIYCFLLTAVAGGAICRGAALQATQGTRASPVETVRFALHRIGWLLSAPLIPVVCALVIGLVIALVGILFNVPGLDILGGLLFGLLLLGGALAACFLIGLALGGNLLYPAIAVEGADAFDAVSRSFSYTLLGRPWRYLFYTAVMIVYGAIGYIVVGLIVFLTLWLTKRFAGTINFWDLPGGVTKLDAAFPEPTLGELGRVPERASLSTTGAVTSWMILAWVKLVLALLPAFAVSYYFCAQTWIYLLLRHAADGTGFDEVFLDQPVAEPDDELDAAADAASPDEGD